LFLKLIYAIFTESQLQEKKFRSRIILLSFIFICKIKYYLYLQRKIMERTNRNRIIIACALLLTFLQVSIIKAVHVHHHDDLEISQTAAHEHSHDSEEGDTCPICNFFLSPFIETTAFNFTFFTESISVLAVRPAKDIIQTEILALYLRAPPKIKFA